MLPCGVGIGFLRVMVLFARGLATRSDDHGQESPEQKVAQGRGVFSPALGAYDKDQDRGPSAPEAYALPSPWFSPLSQT